MSKIDKRLTAVVIGWLAVVVLGCSATIFTEPGTTFTDYLQVVGYVTLGLIGVCAFCGLFFLTIYWATNGE